MPAHSDSEVGMRLGITSRRLRARATVSRGVAPQLLQHRVEQLEYTPEWRSSTGLGRPVVPDVNWMSAMSGS